MTLPTETEAVPPPVVVAPARAADEALWAIGWLALLLIPVLIGDSTAAVAVALWGALALLAWLAGTAGPLWTPALLLRRAAGPLIAYIVLAGLALAGRLDLAGVALAPLAVLLLAALLPRADTAPAGRDWALALVALLWAGVGALGLAGLLTFPAELRSDAVIVLALLLAYHAGRRAARLQRLSERVAIGVGVMLALLGSFMLVGDPSALALVAGLILGLAAVAYAPAPPPVPGADRLAQALRAIAAVHQHLVFVAPITFGILWLVRTFL